MTGCCQYLDERKNQNGEIEDVPLDGWEKDAYDGRVIDCDASVSSGSRQIRVGLHMWPQTWYGGAFCRVIVRICA